MASGYKLKDGRDFDNVFYQYNGGQTLNYKIQNGTDIGTRYYKANSGITTGYRTKSGQDIGTLCGNIAFPQIQSLNISSVRYNRLSDRMDWILQTRCQANTIFQNAHFNYFIFAVYRGMSWHFENHGNGANIEPFNACREGNTIQMSSNTYSPNNVTFANQWSCCIIPSRWYHGQVRLFVKATITNPIGTSTEFKSNEFEVLFDNY